AKGITNAITAPYAVWSLKKGDITQWAGSSAKPYCAWWIKVYDTTMARPAMNNQKKRWMFRGSRNSRVASKYMVHTNQRRANRNFRETNGMLLGTTQIAIQINCKMMAMVTGWRQILGSITFPSKLSFRIKSSINAT